MKHEMHDMRERVGLDDLSRGGGGGVRSGGSVVFYACTFFFSRRARAGGNIGGAGPALAAAAASPANFKLTPVGIVRKEPQSNFNLLNFKFKSLNLKKFNCHWQCRRSRPAGAAVAAGPGRRRRPT